MLRTSDPARFRRVVESTVKWHRSGLDQFIARARGGKPLPPQFAKAKKVYRILPDRNMLALDVDLDAPFGLSNKGAFPEKSKSWFYFRSHDVKRIPNWANILPRYPIGESRSKDRLDGKYRYLFLGRMPVEADSQLAFSRISPQSSFCLAPVFDPKRPNRLYSMHVLIAFAPDKSWVKVAELVVIPTDEYVKPAPGKGGKPLKVRKDTQNEFV